MTTTRDPLAVLRHLANTVLPAKLWDGNNPYCHRPGREGSEYSDDMRALHEAIAQVEALYRVAKDAERRLTYVNSHGSIRAGNAIDADLVIELRRQIAAFTPGQDSEGGGHG